METLSLIALILLSLVGYSAGVAYVSKRISDPKPILLDLTLIALVWAGAIYVKMTFGINRWLLILIFAVTAFLIACLVSSLKQGRSIEAKSKSEDSEFESPESLSFWKRWKGFSKKMGGFQSRTILSFFYFIIVLPFALGVRVVSDPLRLKFPKGDSHWLAKKPLDPAQDSFRKQF